VKKLENFAEIIFVADQYLLIFTEFIFADLGKFLPQTISSHLVANFLLFQKKEAILNDLCT